MLSVTDQETNKIIYIIKHQLHTFVQIYNVYIHNSCQIIVYIDILRAGTEYYDKLILYVHVTIVLVLLALPCVLFHLFPLCQLFFKFFHQRVSILNIPFIQYTLNLRTRSNLTENMHDDKIKQHNQDAY